MSRKYKTKSHKCEVCGEIRPNKFRENRKTICTKCYNKRALDKSREDSDYVCMTPEEQKEYIDTPIVRTTPKSVDEALGLI